VAGLPNTSDVQAVDVAPITVSPVSAPNDWLIALGLLAGAAGLTLATLGSRRHVRFRRRRRQPASRATFALIGVVSFAIAAGQLGLAQPSNAPSAVSATTTPAAVADEVGARADLVGPANVARVAPAAPVAMTFHAATGAITPSWLRIPAIGVDAPVAGVRLLVDGSMGAPASLWSSAWLSSGPRPGQAGSTVIAGHRGVETQALFSHLENVRPGDQIRVSDAGGGELVYEVTRVASMDLSVATQLQVFGPTTQQQLVLVTCFGKYSQATRTYDHRLVVFSRLLPA